MIEQQSHQEFSPISPFLMEPTPEQQQEGDRGTG